MAKSDHRIKNVRVSFGQYVAECSCGKWAGKAKTARAVKSLHRDHVNEFK